MQQVGGRPLLDTKPDQALYVARPALEETLWAAVRRRLNVLVLGEPGSGKTTLLRHLTYALRNEDAAALFVEAATTTDARGLIALLSSKLARSGELQQTSAPRGDGQLLDLVTDLRSVAENDPHTFLLIDSLPNASDAHALFGRLRDELWQLPFTWIVAADDAHRSAYLTPPADAFFDVVLDVPPLTQQQRRELLAARLGSKAPRFESLAIEGSGNPRRLLAMAREAIVSGKDSGDVLGASADRHMKAARLGRAAAMLLVELETRGAASASDERLLANLGWTRARAVQVFKQLETAGLVTSYEHKGPAGRPRKMYQVAGTRGR